MAKAKASEKNEQPQEEVEQLTRFEAVHKALAEVEGDTSYLAIIGSAHELLQASGDADWDDEDATWKIVERACDSLQGLNLIEQTWDVQIHPLRAGKLGNGNDNKNGK
jgi:hypothetical protein